MKKLLKLSIFLIILFSGFQLYSMPINKIGGVSLEAIKQVFFLYFLIIILFSQFLRNKRIQFNKHAFNIPLILFFCFLIFGLLYTPNYFCGLVDIFKILYVIISFLIFIKFFSTYYKIIDVFSFIDKTIKFVFCVFSVGIVINVLLGKYISSDTGGFLISGLSGRALGAMFSSILTLYFLNQYFFLKRFHYVILFGLGSVIVLFSYSRISIFSWLLSIFIICIWHRRIKFLILIFCIGLILFMSVKNYYFKEVFIGDIESIADIKGMTFLELIRSIRLSGRITLWNETITGFLHSPIWGNGTGHSNFVVKSVTGTIEQVHSDYLKILSDLGVIGLSLYLVIYLNMFKKARQIYLSDKIFFRKPYIIFLITLFQILLFSFTDNVISYGPYLLIYLFLFYVILIYWRNHQIKQRKS